MNSVVSQSKSLSAEAFGHKSVAAQSSILFAFFDQITQNTELPNSLIFIAYTYISFQVIDIVMWDPNPMDPFAFFTDGTTNHVTLAITHVIFFLIAFINLGFPLVFYQYTGRFLTWSLYCARFSVEIIIPLFMGPVAWEFGILFSEISSKGTKTETYVFLAMYILIYIFYIIVFYISQVLLRKTAFMSTSPLHGFSPMVLIMILYVHNILIFLLAIFVLLPRWTFYVLCVFHFFLEFFGIYLVLQLPYIQFWVNAYFASLFATTLVGDVIWMAQIAWWIRATVMFSGFVLFNIIFQTVLHYKIRNIRGLLRMPESVPDDGNAYDYLREIGTDNHFIEFLNVGLKYHCQLLTNFQLIKYALDRDRSMEVTGVCLRVVVLFPTQTSSLNMLFKTLDRNVKIPLGEKFLLYQVHRIKLLRQSASSAAAAAKFEEMKTMSKTLKSHVSSFWLSENPTASSLMQLKRDMDLCSTKWEEAVKNFPNSQLHREEYVRYLVDGVTDFQEACKQHCISGLLETGKNFSIDYCFRSLIYLCPEYLKKGILDINGNIKDEKAKKGSSSSNSKQVTDSFSSELDAKMEESIARVILKQARLRLALQNTLKSKTSNHLQKLTLWSITNFFISIVVFTAVFLIFKGFFNKRFQSNDRNLMANEFQFYILLSGLFNLAGWANQTDRINPAGLIAQTEPISYKPIWYLDNFFEILGKSAYHSRMRYIQFIKAIADLAVTGDDVYKLASVLLVNSINFTSCADGKPSDPTLINLQTYYFIVSSSFLLSNSNTSYDLWWTDNEYFCRGYVSVAAFEDGIEYLRTNLVDSEYTDSEQEKVMIEYIEIFLPIGFGIVLLVPFIVFFIFSLKEINNLIVMMMKTSIDYKNEASRTLLRQTSQVAISDQTDQPSQVSNSTSSNTLITLVSIFALLATAGEVVIIVAVLVNCADLNVKFEYMNYWSLKNSMQEGMVIDVCIHAMISIFVNGTGPLNITQQMVNIDDLQVRVKSKLDKINTFRNDLVQGTKKIKSILGFDPEIDRLMNLPACTLDSQGGNTSVHDMYACGSITQQLAFFENLVTDMMAKLSKLNATFINFVPQNMWHIVVAHAVPQLKILDSKLQVLMKNFVSDFNSQFTTLYAVGIVISFVALISYLLIIKILQKPYEAAIILLRRIPPIGIVNNTKLIDYLLNRNSEKNSSEMNTTRAVIHNWSDAIFLLSHAGTIESVNLAVTKILGYTPEQLLGQHFSSLFKDSDKEKISQQLQFIISKQSVPTFDDHFNCLSDTEQTVPCLTMIFGMSDDGSQNGDIESFVIVLRDETILLEHQEAAEKAKKQSEELLFQILPRDIVIRLNQGEKDISFEVPSASIMFIDIVKFSEFSSSLTPSEIMGTLSTLFGGFDEALAKYPLITKIKLIGDVYMCAAGLFNPNEPPQFHAEQLIRFGLDALQIVDEMNIKMTINLSVRIGMNSGGPLIAGVLGTDKPVFDIIGDPINIASRLQSTDIPSRIQISQSSYDLVTGSDFNIEPRGEVFLKGKGKTKAFLVKPVDAVIGSYLSHSSLIM